MLFNIIYLFKDVIWKGLLFGTAEKFARLDIFNFKREQSEKSEKRDLSEIFLESAKGKMSFSDSS